MFATSVNQNFWNQEELAAAPIPNSARQFLAEVGLPTTVGDFSFELGVYNSDVKSLVIGVDGEDGIVIDENGTVLVLKAKGDAAVFVNSSVESFSRFLHVMGKLNQQGRTGLKMHEQEWRELRESLGALDAEAMIDDGQHLWCLLVNDMQALAF